jgi:hypothetical protein
VFLSQQVQEWVLEKLALVAHSFRGSVLGILGAESADITGMGPIQDGELSMYLNCYDVAT